MGKDFKQRAAYHMLHSDINAKHLNKYQLSCKLKWRRHNFDIAEDRIRRNAIKDKIFWKDANNEIDSLCIDNK